MLLSRIRARPRGAGPTIGAVVSALFFSSGVLVAYDVRYTVLHSELHEEGAGRPTVRQLRGQVTLLLHDLEELQACIFNGVPAALEALDGTCVVNVFITDMIVTPRVDGLFQVTASVVSTGAPSGWDAQLQPPSIEPICVAEMIGLAEHASSNHDGVPSENTRWARVTRAIAIDTEKV